MLLCLFLVFVFFFCVCVCLFVCVKSSQVKIFFNDGSLNKHFTCFFFFLHQAIRTINYEREKEREVCGGGGRGGEESCKSEQTKGSGSRNRALLIILYTNSNESCKHEQYMNKPVDIYTSIHTYICTYLDDSLEKNLVGRKRDHVC